MRSGRILSLCAATLPALLTLTIQSAYAQAKPAGPQITVYESPT